MFECIKRLIFWDYYNSRRVLNEDLLILIFDYLPIQQIIELKKISPQFSYCVEEVAKRRIFLVLCQNQRAFQTIFYIYNKCNDNELNVELIKNSVIRFESMKVKESLKLISKRCPHLNVLAISQQIKDKEINSMIEFSKRVDTLCLGSSLLSDSSETFDSIERKVEKIGDIFGNTIRCLYLEFLTTDSNTNPRIITLLRKCSKLEEFKIYVKDSIDRILEYIPKTLKVLIIFRGSFEYTTQYRQQFKDMIQRIENKFTAFRMSYPLDKELLQILK